MHCVSIGDVFFVDVPAILRFSLILLFIRLRNVFGQLEGSLEVIGVVGVWLLARNRCLTHLYNFGLIEFWFLRSASASLGSQSVLRLIDCCISSVP